MLVRSRAALVLLTLALLAACGFPVSQTGTSTLVFVTPDSQVATLGARGGPVVISPSADPTPAGPRLYGWPAWSPDAQRIAFLAVDGDGEAGAVFIADPTGGNRRLVHETQASYPALLNWSPDGARLAVLTAANTTLRLTLVDVDSQADARTIATGQPIYSSWSSDGRAIMTHVGDRAFATARSEVFLVSANPDDPWEADVDLDPGEFRAPAWSPTANRQALVGDNELGEVALFMREEDGTQRRFGEVRGLTAAVWSPAGDFIAWTSTGSPALTGDKEPRFDGLRVASADGRARFQPITEPLLAFFWSPDGQRIAYITSENHGDYTWKVAPREGGESRVLATFQPTPEFQQLVLFFDQYAQSVTPWSSDSQRLLYAGWPAGDETERAPALYTVSIDGAEARPLADGRIGFYAPTPRR